MGNFKLSKNSKANLKGVYAPIVDLIVRALKKSEHDFGIPKHGGKRSPQEQNNLFHLKPRVTWKDGFKNLSYHQSGMAFDIFVFDEHGACWDCREKYKEIWEVIKEEFELMKAEGLFSEDQNIYWGGNWTKFVDIPHFEVR